MGLKTRGKLVALGLVTFGCAAALAAGGVALADDGPGQPMLRITTTDTNTGTPLQQVQQQSPDARDCPFGHHDAPADQATQDAGGNV